MKEEDLAKLSKEELLDIILNYDEYVQQIINENEGEPVCLLEYVNNDYQNLLEDREREQADYELTSFWNDKEAQKTEQYNITKGE